MVLYSLFLALSIIVAVQAAAIYQGCFQLSGSPPNSPIVTYNVGQNLSLQLCLNQAISDGAAAFGLRVASTTGYCFTGPLPSFTAIANLSATTYCNSSAPGDHLYPCGMRYGTPGPSAIFTAVVYKIVNSTCINTSWSAWSACSQTCDNAVQNRYQILNNGTGCNSATLYQYQSCGNAATCQAKSTASTPLRTQYTSLNGYYAYSSCYFLASSSGNAGTVCTAQSRNPDTKYRCAYPPPPSRVRTPRTSDLCYRSSVEYQNGFSDHIYSSYTTITGNLITELQSPESSTTELDAHSCGARCSRIISCLGFNFRSSDLSCIPTKVSIRTPMTVSRSQVYSMQIDPTWTFFDRT